MGSKLYHVILWLAVMCTPNSNQQRRPWNQDSRDRWKTQEDSKEALSRCHEVTPTPRDIVKRIYAILPYFVREKDEDAEFLQHYRLTLKELTDSYDMVDREAGFFAAVLVPIVFLQRLRDAKCLIDRFNHALHDFQTIPSMEKKKALKLLQNLRDLSYKIHMFVSTLPEKTTPTTQTPSYVSDEEAANVEGGKTPSYVSDEEAANVEGGNLDKNEDIRYLKELIQNLG